MATQKTNDRSKELRESVARQILELMEKDGLRWSQGFDRTMFLAQNPCSPTSYKGCNRAWLAFLMKERHLADPRFCTFAQAKENGWKVKKGSKSTFIECWKPLPCIIAAGGARKWLKKDEVPLYDAEDVHWPLCLVGTANVFSFEDIEGPGAYLPEPGPEGFELADALEESSRCGVFNAAVQAACYRPSVDQIVMPPRGAFDDPNEYTATLLHEMAHSTAKPLGRACPDSFRNCSYAYEELCAEFASVFASAELGIPIQPSIENHSAYLQSWLSVCGEDTNALDRALSVAQGITDYLLDNLATRKAGGRSAA